MTRSMWVAVFLFTALIAAVVVLLAVSEPSPLSGVVVFYVALAFVPFASFFLAKAFSVSHHKIREAERELNIQRERDQAARSHAAPRAPSRPA
jgi:hypothetical protein